MTKEEFKELIRPIVYKYGSGWLLDNSEMLEEICKKYHNKQLTIHSVVLPTDKEGTLCEHKEWVLAVYHGKTVKECGKCHKIIA
jgi:hypothetical protein